MRVLADTTADEYVGGTDSFTSSEGDDKETLAALRVNTQTGRPLASDSFLSKLEHTLGRRLRPLPVGRPKKEKSETRKRRK